MVYNSSETQVTKDSYELYALPSSKKKCAGKNQLNHIRRLPPNELRDYSQSFLQYLDKSGIRVIIHYIDDKLTNKVDKIELINLVTKEDLDHITVDLTGYVNQKIANIPEPEPYDDSELRELIENIKNEALVSLYHFKGTVTNLIELESIQNPEVGDVYILTDFGTNAVWSGTQWDQFDFIIDLDDYFQPITIAELDSILR